MKIVLALFPLLLATCTLDVNRLVGRWRAIAFYEQGQSHAAPLDSVVLAFTSSGHYEFRSAGFYRENGPFRVSGQHLFLTDTTEHPAKEHILKVLFLSGDTLKIQMQKGDNEQVLFFEKQL
ncbi:MAG: hypothetical protein DYG98_21720 [Haliscomenobacteraceae bacterium CHB4]|nr:hypothetical protein [Saprospiraceae bacterium]MCE7925678.1 hypothetical protein [Haliscomenobacteraceae bacterium CHB4]